MDCRFQPSTASANRFRIHSHSSAEAAHLQVHVWFDFILFFECSFVMYMPLFPPQHCGVPSHNQMSAACEDNTTRHTSRMHRANFYHKVSASTKHVHGWNPHSQDLVKNSPQGYALAEKPLERYIIAHCSHHLERGVTYLRVVCISVAL